MASSILHCCVSIPQRHLLQLVLPGSFQNSSMHRQYSQLSTHVVACQLYRPVVACPLICSSRLIVTQNAVFFFINSEHACLKCLCPTAKRARTHAHTHTVKRLHAQDVIVCKAKRWRWQFSAHKADWESRATMHYSSTRRNGEPSECRKPAQFYCRETWPFHFRHSAWPMIRWTGEAHRRRALEQRPCRGQAGSAHFQTEEQISGTGGPGTWRLWISSSTSFKEMFF